MVPPEKRQVPCSVDPLQQIQTNIVVIFISEKEVIELKAKHKRKFYVKQGAFWAVFDRAKTNAVAGFRTRAQAYWYADRLNKNKPVK